jgi:hypothetical protein
MPSINSKILLKMKYLIFIITLLCFNSSVFSQDSISVRTEVDTFSKANYEGQFDYVFARKEPRKQLIKLSGIIGRGYNSIDLAYERKLATDFSINISLGNVIQGFIVDALINKFKKNNPIEYGLGNTLNLKIQPRWYYTMKKDIKNGLISDNLNGNYIGLSINASLNKSQFDNEYENYATAFELKWGMQRRILKNQYFDFHIGTGLNHNFNNYNEFGGNQNQNYWFFNSGFTYGFILDNNLFKKEKKANCDALRCFEEEKSLWKFRVTDAFSANATGINSNLSIANESKINNSQWSIENRLSLGASQNVAEYKGAFGIKKLKSNDLGVGFQITPRLYWDLNKRIAKGQSANNLAGKYIGLMLSYSYSKGEFSDSGNIAVSKIYNLTSKVTTIAPIIGYQKRLLNHLYLDAFAGYYVSWFNSNSNNIAYTNNFRFQSFLYGYTLGLCF